MSNKTLLAALTLSALALVVPVAFHAQDSAAPARSTGRRLALSTGRADGAAKRRRRERLALEGGRQWPWPTPPPSPRPGYDASGPDWQAAAPGDDVFHGRVGYAWFRATLPDVPGPRRTLHLGADDNADVYLNGMQADAPRGLEQPVRRAAGRRLEAGRAERRRRSASRTPPARAAWSALSWSAWLPAAAAIRRSPASTTGLARRPPAARLRGGGQRSPPRPTPATAPCPPPRPGTARRSPCPPPTRARASGSTSTASTATARSGSTGHSLGEHPSGYTSFRYDISQSGALRRHEHPGRPRGPDGHRRAGGTRAAASTGTSG